MERSTPTTARSSRPDADPEQRQTPYLDALVEYAAREPGRFHVPGHKGGSGADAAMVEAFGATALEHDIPALIEGIDAGPEPTPDFLRRSVEPVLLPRRRETTPRASRCATTGGPWSCSATSIPRPSTG